MNITIPAHSTIMFVKSSSELINMSQLPNKICNKQSNSKAKINLLYKYNSEKSILNLNQISSHYSILGNIEYEQFIKSKEKTAIITIDLAIKDLMNLQYLLVMHSYMKSNNIKYYIIFNTDNTYDTYFKISHYFRCGILYEELINNIFVRRNNSVSHLPQKETNYMPGEIFPYFHLNKEFYSTCLKNFNYSEKLSQIIKELDDKSQIYSEILINMPDISRTEAMILGHIYSYLSKSSSEKSIINFLYDRPDTPILAALIFSAILQKKLYKHLDVLYENCLDYALGLEQLVENTYFYANEGVLSIRIHEFDSDVLSDVLSNSHEETRNVQCRYFLEVSLVDFQEPTKDAKTIVSCFIKDADANEQEKDILINTLSKSDGLKVLFQPNENLKTYYNKVNVLIQHYGLRIISMLAQKTSALLCVRSGNYFFTNVKPNGTFKEQSAEQYPYDMGTYYRILIPIKETEPEHIYIGFNDNKYDEDLTKEKYKECSIHINGMVPNNREDKLSAINEIKKQILMNCNNEEQVLVIKTIELNNRLHIEYLVKAVLSAISERSKSKKKTNIALIGFQNKTFVKFAVRIIALCYVRNDIFKNNEIFLCDKDCFLEVLIAGNSYNNIVETISAQRIFGTIDDELFKEIKLTLQTMKGDS